MAASALHYFVLRKKALLWAIFLCSTVLLVVGLHHLQLLKRNDAYPIVKHPYFNYDLDHEEPVLDPKQTCLIPRIHPFDKSIIRYLESQKSIICKNRQDLLTYIDASGTLRFNDTALKCSRYERGSLSCTYQAIRRANGSDNEVDFDAPKQMPEEGIELECDFVTVICYNFVGIKVYQNIHAHVHKLINHHAKSSTKFGKSSLERVRPIRRPAEYNVLIFGIDSMSRLGFIRDLPRTYHYLKNVMGAVVLRGMTKVGDNTFPNLVALLTGNSPYSGRLPKVSKDGYYDEWPFVWNLFSSQGYVTMYAEDRPKIATFNYLRNGFFRQPTDHYLRPFWLAVEYSMLHRLSSPLCYGGIPKHILQMNYITDFILKYSEDIPFFAFSFLVEISHDYTSHVREIDDDLEAWLRDLFDSGVFDKTVLFFMSDHGHRFNAVRATLVGRIEERMPMFAVYVPSKLRQEQPDAYQVLAQNSGRLTSPYDSFYTLLDLLRYCTEGKPLGTAISGQGRTLFAPIPPNRTCANAGITDHYCTCEEETPAEVDDQRVIKAAKALLETLNSLVSVANGNSTLCAPMNLVGIQRADVVVPSRKVIVNSRVYFGRLVEDSTAQGLLAKYKIIVKVSPSGGVFEATVLYRKDEDAYSVLGDISRINEYGQESSCIDDPVLRKFCYCYSLLTS